MLRPELKEELRLELAARLDVDRLELVLEGFDTPASQERLEDGKSGTVKMVLASVPFSFLRLSHDVVGAVGLEVVAYDVFLFALGQFLKRIDKHDKYF